MTITKTCSLRISHGSLTHVLFSTLFIHTRRMFLFCDYRPVILLKRVHLSSSSAALNKLLMDMCSRLSYKVSRMMPCSLTGLDVQVRLPGEDVVEICLSSLISFNPEENGSLKKLIEGSDVVDHSDPVHKNENIEHVLSMEDSMDLQGIHPSPPIIETGRERLFAPSYVFLTPLTSITGYRVKRYCGLVVLHFIRETWHLEEQASMNNYSHKFLLEVLSVAKAHVRCIGGNALLSVRILPQETAEEDVNQAYSMITISGDAALMEEDK